jgi:sterol desaturase/sphingolipid hydroxylase (fatty acid hydroxylase superfamily)
LAFGLSLIFVENLDSFVAVVWRRMYQSTIVKNDSFEPLLSTFSFFIWINMFRIIDFYGLFQAYRIVPLEKAISNWGEGYSVNSSLRNQNFKYLFYLLRPFQFILPQSWRGLAAIAYLAPLLLFDSVYPRRILPEESPSFHGLLGSVCLSIFCYDFAFYWIHLAMHRVKILYTVHKTHHAAEALCAVEVIHHGLIDGALQVTHFVSCFSTRETSPVLGPRFPRRLCS